MTYSPYRSVESHWRGNEDARRAGRNFEQRKMPNGQIATPVRKESVTLHPLVGGVCVETHPEDTGETQHIPEHNYEAYHAGGVICEYSRFSIYPEYD